MFSPKCSRCYTPIIVLINQGIYGALTYALSFGSIFAFALDPKCLGRGFGVSSAIANILGVVAPLVLG